MEDCILKPSHQWCLTRESFLTRQGRPRVPQAPHVNYLKSSFSSPQTAPSFKHLFLTSEVTPKYTCPVIAPLFSSGRKCFYHLKLIQTCSPVSSPLLWFCPQLTCYNSVHLVSQLPASTLPPSPTSVSHTSLRAFRGNGSHHLFSHTGIGWRNRATITALELCTGTARLPHAPRLRQTAHAI